MDMRITIIPLKYFSISAKQKTELTKRQTYGSSVTFCTIPPGVFPLQSRAALSEDETIITYHDSIQIVNHSIQRRYNFPHPAVKIAKKGVVSGDKIYTTSRKLSGPPLLKDTPRLLLTQEGVQRTYPPLGLRGQGGVTIINTTTPAFGHPSLSRRGAI